jgi:Mrp family chromosome partitioning ATPase
LRLPASHGFNELLSDPDRDLDQVARWYRGGIHIIEAGRVAAENRASLASPQAHRLFQRLRHRFPYIVVDAPPILAVAEGLILQQMVSTVLLVTRARVTQRPVARRALLSLDPSRLAGVVVNDLDPAASYECYYPQYEQRAGAGVAAGGAGR